MPRLSPLIPLALSMTLAWAQAPTPFVGTWKVTWEGKKQVLDAKLVLNESGGTWKTSTQQESNPCVGKEVPVKVESSTPQEVKLLLAFSVLHGCKDSKVTLTLGADSTVSGRRGDADLKLKRE